MSELWLARSRLRATASVATLAPLLLPHHDDDRVSSGHRLMWSLFTRGDPAMLRPFLWREGGKGVFYTLSTEPPTQDHALLEVDPPKIFAPALSVGDRLRFSLRANPTIARPLDSYRTQRRDSKAKPSRRTAHHDVVMYALHALPHAARAESRRAVIESAGRQWLERQAARCGFQLAPVVDDHDADFMPSSLRIDGYRVLQPPRSRKSAPMRIAVLDFEGVLIVSDPNRFLSAVAAGFGRAKAYGCGLMLIARA